MKLFNELKQIETQYNIYQLSRQEAIKKLILTAESMTKEAGSKYMMSISRSNSLLKTHEQMGWSVDKTPSHEMIKVII